MLITPPVYLPMSSPPGIDPNSELTEEDVRAQVSERDLMRIYEMSKDRNIYQNLATSMFPTIHGTCYLVCLLLLFDGCEIRVQYYFLILGSIQDTVIAIHYHFRFYNVLMFRE